MITRYDLLTEYCLQRNQELADALLGRKALFLDTRAWVHLSRAVSGDATQIAWLPVLHLLRELVAAGRIFCPTTMTTISEVVSQADAATRLATAELLDELSLGVGFCAPDEQLLDEVDSEMRRRVDGYEPQHVIWTKGCMTFMRPSLLELDVSLPQGLPAFERAFDEVWNTPVSRLIEATGHLPGIDVSEAIERLSAGNWAHVDEISRFDRLLGVECRAVAELAANVTHPRVRRHVVRQLIASGSRRSWRSRRTNGWRRQRLSRGLWRRCGLTKGVADCRHSTHMLHSMPRSGGCETSDCVITICPTIIRWRRP